MAKQIIIRHPELDDFTEFSKLFLKPGNNLAPYIYPPVSSEDFSKYIDSLDGIRKIGFIICQNDTKEIMGVINISEIIMGVFRNAFLGYYIAKEYEGKGYMQEGLSEVIAYAFDEIGLHRLEANIQPSNSRSISLVQKLGFKKEGYSEKYLKINGEWKDHERWALIKEHRAIEKL